MDYSHQDCYDGLRMGGDRVAFEYHFAPNIDDNGHGRLP